MPALTVLVVAFVASLAMAWSVGAESNSPPFAPAVGAKALPVMRAALLVGVFAALGAIFQGANISHAIGSDLIKLGPEAAATSITPLAAASALLTAATFVGVGVRRGYPIPAAFTVTGSVIGVGLSMGGDPAMMKYQQIAGLWLAIPFLGGGVSFTTAYLLRRDDVPETMSIPLLAGFVGAALANIQLTLLPAETGNQNSLAGAVSMYLGNLGAPLPRVAAGVDAAVVVTTLLLGLISFFYMRRRIQTSVDSGVKFFLIALGSVVAFSSGGSQVGLATGPLNALFEESLRLPTVYLLGLGGLGILAGSWTGAPRLLHAVSREYASLGLRRSIAALVPAFLIAQIAITVGVPISFNEIIISSVIGSGLVEGRSGTSGRKIAYTVAAWLFSIVATVAVGYGVYAALTTLSGVA